MIKMDRYYTEERSVLNTDTFDRNRFCRMVDLYPKMKEVISDQAKKNNDYPALMGDMWASLYKMKPSLKNTSESQSESAAHHVNSKGSNVVENPLKANEKGESVNAMNSEIMKRILEDEEYKKMRYTTKLDDFASSIGSLRLNEQVHSWIKEKADRDDKMQELMKQMQQLQKKIDQQEAKEQDENSSSTQVKNAKKKLEQLNGDMSDLQQQMAEMISDKVDGMDGGFSSAIQKANQETQDAKNQMQDLLAGGSSAGNGEAEMQKLPLKDQLKLAEKLRQSPKLKDIAEWAGNFKAIARKKQKVKHEESLERSGVTFGSEIERVMPQEFALLKDDRTKGLFYQNLLEKKTQMYSPGGKVTLGKGPIVICLDQSGSMFSLDTQSKGFVLALAMIAKKQRRDFAVITFSNDVGKVFEYEKGKISPHDLVELAEYFQGGGTQYGPPLKIALETVERKKRFKNADIIFITDGDPSDTGVLNNRKWISELKERKSKMKTNILALLIGDDVSTVYVERFSDEVVRASDFNHKNAQEAFTI